MYIYFPSENFFLGGIMIVSLVELWRYICQWGPIFWHLYVTPRIVRVLGGSGLLFIICMIRQVWST